MNEAVSKQQGCRAFQLILSDQNDWHPPSLGLIFDRLDEVKAASWEVIFTEKEIYGTPKNLNGDKGSTPDGF